MKFSCWSQPSQLLNSAAVELEEFCDCLREQHETGTRKIALQQQQLRFQMSQRAPATLLRESTRKIQVHPATPVPPVPRSGAADPRFSRSCSTSKRRSGTS